MHCLSQQKIVFMPGIDGTGMSFEPLRNELPQTVQATVVSYPADRLLSFEETLRSAEDQSAAADGAIVIAESFSGPVAAQLIGSGRLKAKALVLSATFARSPRPILLKLIDMLPAEFIVGLPAPKALMRHIVRDGQSTEVFLSLLKKIRRVVPPRTLAHRLKVVDRLDVRQWLPGIKIPCLYLQPTSDLTVPARCLSDFTELVEDLRVKRIEGPHFLLQARPRQSAAAIEKFISAAGLAL